MYLIHQNRDRTSSQNYYKKGCENPEKKKKNSESTKYESTESVSSRPNPNRIYKFLLSLLFNILSTNEGWIKENDFVIH